MNTVTQILPIVQLIISLLLILAILAQRSGDGIEGALGGSSANLTYFVRRGGERFLFVATIVLAILFAVTAIIGILA
jgi:protein translocase SecG subunit